MTSQVLHTVGYVLISAGIAALIASAIHSHTINQLEEEHQATIDQLLTPKTITCPGCNKTSTDPHNIFYKYCGYCRKYHGQIVKEGNLYGTSINIIDHL